MTTETEAEKLERERQTYLENRTGAGRARSEIKRKLVRRTDEKYVRGTGFIIRPKTFGRDSFRSLMHFAKTRGITLCKIDVMQGAERTYPDGKPRTHETVLSWLAIGPAAALRELANHDYVGAGNWQFATTAQVAQMGG
jgi:hypothetical protein